MLQAVMVEVSPLLPCHSFQEGLSIGTNTVAYFLKPLSPRISDCAGAALVTELSMCNCDYP